MGGIALCVVGALTVAPGLAARSDAVLVPVAFEQTQPKPSGAEQPTPPKTAAGNPGAESGPPRAAQLANVRLDVTITDQRGSGQPTTKTISLVLADRAPGRIRTTGEVRVAMQVPGSPITNSQTRPVILNVDAYPEFTRDGRVRAQVTLEYKPVAAEAAKEEEALTTISESFAVILEDGKPLVVSQSADPSTDRRVRVEVKATILK